MTNLNKRKQQIRENIELVGLSLSAFFTLDREGQIPTPYPSSTFTVPQCKFALRAIIRTANSGYAGISQLGVYPMITRGNPVQSDITHPNSACRFSPMKK